MKLQRFARVLLCLLLALCLPLTALAQEDGCRADFRVAVDGEEILLSMSAAGEDANAALTVGSNTNNYAAISLWLEEGETLHVQYGQYKTSVALSDLAAYAQAAVGSAGGNQALSDYLANGLMTDLLQLGALGDSFTALFTDALQLELTAEGWAVTLDGASLRAVGQFLIKSLTDAELLDTLCGLSAWDAFAPGTPVATRRSTLMKGMQQLASECIRNSSLPVSLKLSGTADAFRLAFNMKDDYETYALTLDVTASKATGHLLYVRGERTEADINLAVDWAGDDYGGLAKLDASLDVTSLNGGSADRPMLTGSLAITPSDASLTAIAGETTVSGSASWSDTGYRGLLMIADANYMNTMDVKGEIAQVSGGFDHDMTMVADTDGSVTGELTLHQEMRELDGGWHNQMVITTNPSTAPTECTYEMTVRCGQVEPASTALFDAPQVRELGFEEFVQQLANGASPSLPVNALLIPSQTAPIKPVVDDGKSTKE